MKRQSSTHDLSVRIKTKTIAKRKAATDRSQFVIQLVKEPSRMHAEFSKVIGCEKCTVETCRHLLRDSMENVPQPGYVGSDYSKTKVLLVGQNPGVSKLSLESLDHSYAAALRLLRDDPTREHYTQLNEVLQDCIPQWPVRKNYFPLEECGLTLNEIAYCNLVRCRTSGNERPNKELARNCVAEHFDRWLSLLAPRVVVFIGKWAWQRGHASVENANIPCTYMNRLRSLSTSDRKANRKEVVDMVRLNRNRTSETAG
jgi:hypothetical protein